MLALSQEEKSQLLQTGWLREVAFKTEPRVNKVHTWAAAALPYNASYAVELVDTGHHDASAVCRAL